MASGFTCIIKPVKDLTEKCLVLGFLVRFFAGAACHTTYNFIERNKDALHVSLEGLVCKSASNP